MTKDKPTPTAKTVIVIFGAAVRPNGEPSAALRQRVDAAIRCGAGLNCPIYIPTGGIGRFPPSEASVMAALLRQGGVPAARIVLEETATDTLSSVRAVRRLARDLGADRVMAATSAYHLPRCVLLLRLAGLHAAPCRPTDAPAATRWTRRWRWRLREVAALPYDALLTIWLRLLGRL